MNDNFTIVIDRAMTPTGWFALTVPGGGFVEHDCRAAYTDHDAALTAALKLQVDQWPGARIVDRTDNR